VCFFWFFPFIRFCVFHQSMVQMVFQANAPFQTNIFWQIFFFCKYLFSANTLMVIQKTKSEPLLIGYPF
jgi:hypothetical protein